MVFNNLRPLHLVYCYMLCLCLLLRYVKIDVVSVPFRSVLTYIVIVAARHASVYLEKLANDSIFTPTDHRYKRKSSGPIEIPCTTRKSASVATMGMSADLFC